MQFLIAVEFFVDNGQDVEATTGNGGTGLMVASQNGKANVVRFLLLKGARVDRVTVTGKTALDVADDGGFTEIVELLTLSACLGQRKLNSKR
uniref:ANK_REP_REGION domain-containing protein n=1 Tax=Globodera pallida TaxID=36090 RepID=A0A183CTD3_GLOPA